MKMEVEKVSKECILPSSPTPSHLKTYKISLLDQFMSHSYIPLILYYPINKETTVASDDFISKRSLLLKKSLSETLTLFYPLAGKIKDHLSIDCNDEGLYYVEARANISLSEYLSQSDFSSMKYLLPVEDIIFSAQTPESYLSMVQETTFTCGGLAICVLVTHVICDGIALSSYIKTWAAKASCNSDNKILYPNFDSPSIFPQHNPFFSEAASVLALCGPFFKKMKVKTRRIVFDASAIASLKDTVIGCSEGGVKNPTRVEVVTALLSKCLMAAYTAKSGGVKKPLAMNFAVNLRRRAVPPLPECSMGNFIWYAAAVCKSGEAKLNSIVWLLREAIREIGGDFVRQLQGDGGYLKLCEITKEIKSVLFGTPSEMEYVVFSSWCNFGFYEIDFGWGSAVWSSCLFDNSETVFVNSIVLRDERKDKGIEAWAYLDEQVLAFLEKNEELLEYACVDPIPWISNPQDC